VQIGRRNQAREGGTRGMFVEEDDASSRGLRVGAQQQPLKNLRLVVDLADSFRSHTNEMEIGNVKLLFN